MADEIDRLRSVAARGDYRSMARLATALYAHGRSPQEVLFECYGVAFPAELFLLDDVRSAKPRLLVNFTNQPWQLATPPARGGPAPNAHSMESVERRVLSRDPDLLPLVRLLHPDPRRPQHVACYRLSELGSGRTTVFSIADTVEPDDVIEHAADSLLALLHRHHLDSLRTEEWQQRQPSNWGAGSVDADDVAEARALVERIEDLLRKLRPDA